jgi:lipopolysaccharide biosynthesis protein
MSGRIFYYLERAKLRVKKQGIGALFSESFFFLLRRKFFLQFLFESFEYHVLASFRDSQATVQNILKHDPITAKRVVLYVSFDAQSRIAEHVVKQLTAFQGQGYQSVFVSTSPEISENDLNKIKNLVSICVLRKNEGYDFASWKVAYSFIAEQAKNLESLVLMNDSCLGPEYDLTETLSLMRSESDVVYGISKSEEIAEHIQSYFYHFGATVLKQVFSHEFFKRIRVVHSKWAVVRYFEIGGSTFLIKNGVKLKALVDSTSPMVKEKMIEAGLTEPTREPLASEWVRLRMSPFYKRSNLKHSQ